MTDVTNRPTERERRTALIIEQSVELDRASVEVFRRDVCESAGARYDGIGEGFVWLTDPQTHSTGVIPLAEFSPEAVTAKLAEIRGKFAGRGSK